MTYRGVGAEDLQSRGLALELPQSVPDDGVVPVPPEVYQEDIAAQGLPCRPRLYLG